MCNNSKLRTKRMTMSNLYIKFAPEDNDFNYQCNFTREIEFATMTKNIRFTILEKYKL